VIGQEGNYGLVTEAIVKIRKVPEVKKFGSVIFPDMESGIKFMEQAGRQGIWAASMRLMDNLQFLFGQSLKPEEHSKVTHLLDAIKKFYILKIKGFDQTKMAAMILVFEGTKEEVKMQENYVFTLAATLGGLNAGEKNGKTGYFLTYVIAYIRDFAANHTYVAESFETSCPWSKVGDLCTNVRARMVEACRKRNIPENTIFCTSRVT
jgi:alkyldihydroxyacetonephosphate synthase